jgi:zinc transporter ZupT
MNCLFFLHLTTPPQSFLSFICKLAEPILPYALAFAAGAMIYVVVDDIIPEAQSR